MPRTVSSRVEDLISSSTAQLYAREIISFIDWCRDHTSLRGNLPFESTPWYCNGYCVIHNIHLCPTCKLFLGRYADQQVRLSSPPSDMIPIVDAWEHFRRTWASEYGSARQSEGGRDERSVHGGTRGDRHERRSPHAAASQDGSPRRISVAVWSDPGISASPLIAADELYIFARTSQRVKLVDKSRGVTSFLRLPDISVADVIERLLRDPRRQELLLVWRQSSSRSSRILLSSTKSVLEEMGKGHLGRDGRRIVLGQSAEGWLEIRNVS